MSRSTQIRAYLTFLLTNRRFLAFGLALTFFSSFGQTFFVGVFAIDIRQTFDLTAGGFGLVYSIATLMSGLTLITVGGWIDRTDLRRFASYVCAGLALACVVIAVSPHVIVLLVGLFLLRFAGQGLMGHTAMTSMARYFDHGRGRAMSIAGLGHPLGEAIFPTMGVAMLALLTWRQTWLTYGLVLAVGLIPLILWLLRGQTVRHGRYVVQMRRHADSAGDSGGTTRHPAWAGRQWTRGEVVRDWRFYCILPAALAQAFIVTGLLFHQTILIEAKDWTAPLFASSFVGFAAAQVPASLLSGVLIDRFSARRLMPFLLWPMAIGVVHLVLFDHPAVAFVFMIFAGLTSGMVNNIVGTLWAELYGVQHIGAIRALTSALMVVSTSLSPFGMGWLIDRGVSIEVIALLCVAYIIAAITLVSAALSIDARQKRRAG